MAITADLGSVNGNVISNQALRRKIEELEKRYDGRFQIAFAAIKEVREAPQKPQRRRGFPGQLDLA